MSSTLTFTSPAAPGLDYMRYLWRDGQDTTKTDKYMSASLLDFALVPCDSSFVKLGRGAYITLNSATYPNWFTGYITNNPDLQFLGADINSDAVWGYVYHATSDEYILTLNPVGIVPPFFNTPMGTIITTLANRLSPGLFDCTNVQPGPTVAQYVPDPTKSFYAVVQDLSDAASYVFYGNNHKLYWVPQNDASIPPVVIDGSDPNFTPANLAMSAVNTPIINDCTVVGQVEPQRYIQEYFLGTGLTSAFQLMDSVFGADSSIYITESFGGSAIDTTKWNIFDDSGEFLQVLDGYLNSLGGSTNFSYDVSLQSLTPIPMEGNIRLTHGEFDFLGGEGIIGGLWTGATSSFSTGVVNGSQAGLLYGIYCNPNGTLNPICDATSDTSQVVSVSINRRYCLRTIAQFSRANRSQQPYSYVDANGVVQSVNTTSPGADTVTWQTYITEIDPTTGIVTNQWVWSNTGALTGTNDTYATYAPIASNSLLCTVTGITVWIPVNAALSTATPAPFVNTSFDTWVTPIAASGWTGESVDGVFQSTTAADGAALYLKQQTSTPYVAQYANGAILPGTAYNVQVLLQRDNACQTGSVKIVLDGTGITETGLTVPVANIPIASFQAFNGVLTVPISAIPSDGSLALKVYLSGCTNTGSGVYVDDLLITTAWTLQLVGPNEIDAVDGFAPVATIVQPNNGTSTTSTYTGAPQYNAGQGQLVFFSDSTTLESNVPSAKELLRVTYRGAGAALGRSVNSASVQAEAASWGDNGVRSIVENSYNPRPRTSAECELAASAVVSENCFQHYQGTYQIRSNFLSAQPRGGAIVQFRNLSNMAPVNAEQVTEVTTVLDYDSPESFIHTITFGKPDLVQQLLDDMQNPVGSFQPDVDAATPAAVDTHAVGLAFAPDVISANVLSWDDNFIYADAGQALVPSGGSMDRHTQGTYFEVRYTDKSWGPDGAQNLMLRTQSLSTNNYGRLFQVARSVRSQCFFIRQCSQWNFVLTSEDMTNGVYSGVGATITNGRAANPDGKLSQLSTVAFSAGGKLEYSFGEFTFPSGWPQQACWSFSVKGPAGTAMTATVMEGPNGSPANTTVATLPIVCNGAWQRFSVPLNSIIAGADYQLVLSCSTAASVAVTRYSVECGTNAETLYVRTKNGVGGIYSRYSAAIHVAFPLPIIPLQALPEIIYVNSDTTLVAPAVGDMLVEIDTSQNPVTVTLPPSSSYIGQNIECVLISYGSANGPTYNDATLLASTESIPGGGSTTDIYNGVSTWTLNTQWQGQEFLGTS